MPLPGGTTKDSRFLTEVVAKTLLEMETKKENTGVNGIEILSLPSQGFTADSMVAILSSLGWMGTASATDNHFTWWQKDNRYIISYFSKSKKSTELYFGEANAMPLFASNGNMMQQQQQQPEQQQSQQPQQQEQQQQQTQQQETYTQQTTIQQPINNTGNFTFTVTNFDDGWTSVIKEDWVEVTKGNLLVLLHYANENVKPANTDPDVMCEAAWNVLVAPRYSNIANYQLSPGMLDYERPYYAQADLTDKATGQRKFVALFKKGNTCWIEFIMPDKNTFIQTFGLDITQLNYYSESAVWNKMVKMNGYNKFAIASTDFKGNWSDHFASNTYYTNVYTGLSAGMSTYSSSQSFEFSAGQQYKWRLVAANTYGGASSFAQAKGKGIFKVLNNWQIHFSEMEGKAKTYDAYFTAIRNGRILWMNDAKYPGSGIFTGFSLSK